MDKLKMHSANLTEANIDKLAELFPNCITEALDAQGELKKTIDFDLLRQELSSSIVEGPQERYQLNWPGKREALLTANAPIAKTLRPCREESVDFDTTQNLFIEGDNLDALKLLQETYLGKVKMIYIDPPYNTGNDFIYEDDFAEDSDSYFERSNQKDESGKRLTANTESNGRFHSDWLSMMYSRLRLARNILRDDGVFFISIDDMEFGQIKAVCDEIFGSDNYIGTFTVVSTPNARDYGHIGKTHEYVHFYAKDVSLAVTNEVEVEEKTFKYCDQNGGFNIHPLYNSNEAFHRGNRRNLYYQFYLHLDRPIDDDFYEISLAEGANSIEIYPPASLKNAVQFVWRWGKEKSQANLNTEIIGYKTRSGEYRIVQKMRHTTKLIRSVLNDSSITTRRGTAEVEEIFGKKIMSFPKPKALIEMLLKVGTNNLDSDIFMDFFAGSCTSADALLSVNYAQGMGNRKYILVQLPEACDESSDACKAGYRTIADIGKERIRRAGQKIKEENSDKEGIDQLDIGFRVLKIDTSNMKEVYYTPDAVSQDLLSDQVDNIREDRTAEDLLFQVLLDWGVDLALPINQQVIAGKTVFFVDGNALAACFDIGIDEDFVKQLAGHKPLRVVFRDAGFANDSVKINVEQVFKLLSPATEIKTL